MLVSKALVRAFDVSRAIAPIDFALVTNGAHWIIDSRDSRPQATTTLRQLAGFAAKIATAEPFGLTCLSATPPGELIDEPSKSQFKFLISNGPGRSPSVSLPSAPCDVCPPTLATTRR